MPDSTTSQQPEEEKDDRMAWETPELIVEDVPSVTQGGSLSTNAPGDDNWYVS